jgi:hypothetical protein
MCYDHIVKSAFDSSNLIANVKPGPDHSHNRPVAMGTRTGFLPTRLHGLARPQLLGDPVPKELQVLAVSLLFQILLGNKPKCG